MMKLRSFILLSILLGLSLPSMAQKEISKRELMLQVLDQSRPNSYVPAAFFMHFHDKLGYKAVNAHREYYKATGMDFVKVFYEITVPEIDINTPSDWDKVPVYSEEYFAPQIQVIADLAHEFRHEALVIPTVYSPLSLLYQTMGKKRGNLRALSDKDPKAFEKAVKNIALSIENYMRAAARAGADGFYISSQGSDGTTLSKKVWTESVRKWDKYVSEVGAEIGLLNILHICDYEAPYPTAEDVFALADYPASIVNVPLNMGDGTVLDIREAQKRFKRPVFGGLDRHGILANGSLDEIKAEVDRVMENAPDNFILGADCTISGADMDKLRQIIEYVHTWRKTHRK